MSSLNEFEATLAHDEAPTVGGLDLAPVAEAALDDRERLAADGLALAVAAIGEPSKVSLSLEFGEEADLAANDSGLFGHPGERDRECDESHDDHGTPLVRIPPPPAEVKRPCGDCAFRKDSPEMDSGRLYRIAEQTTPFYCHQGMHCTADGRYQPRQVDAEGMPVGHPLCAGWLAAQRKRERAEATR